MSCDSHTAVSALQSSHVASRVLQHSLTLLSHALKHSCNSMTSACSITSETEKNVWRAGGGHRYVHNGPATMACEREVNGSRG